MNSRSPAKYPTTSAIIIACRQDSQAANKLGKALQRYRLPKALVGTPSRDGPVAKRIDRIQYSYQTPWAESEQALTARYAIVVCSPAATESAEVDRWVKAFKHRNKADRLLCYIHEGEPNASDKNGNKATEAFPKAVRFQLNHQGELSSKRAEPIAADSRPHADGPGNARLKLLAGLYAVRYEALRQRAKQRQRRQALLVGSLLAMTLCYAAVLGWKAWQEQQHAATAQFITAMQTAFATLNQNDANAFELADNAIKAYGAAAQSSAWTKSFKLRQQHAQLSFEQPHGQQTVDFLLSANDGNAVLGIRHNATDLQLLLSTGQLLKVPNVAGYWQPQQGTPTAPLLYSAELQNAHTLWLLLAWHSGWQLQKVQLPDGVISQYPQRTSTLLSHGWSADRHPQLGTIRSLFSGHVVTTHQDRFEIHAAGMNPSAIAGHPPGFTLQNLQRFFWSELDNRLYLQTEQQGLYRRGPDDKAWQTLIAPAKQTAELRWSNRKRFVSALRPDEQGITSTRLWDLKTDQTHTLGQLQLTSLTGLKGQILSLASVEHFSDAQIFDYHLQHRSLSAPWPVVLPHTTRLALHDGLQYWLNKGMLHRYGPQAKVALSRWPVDCAPNATAHTAQINNGVLDCLSNQQQWLRYRLAKHSPQTAISLPAVIRQVTALPTPDHNATTEQQLAIIANTADHSHLYQTRQQPDQPLAISHHFQTQAHCLMAIQAGHKGALIAALSGRGHNLFANAPCTYADPLNIARFEPSTDGTFKSQPGLQSLAATASLSAAITALPIKGVYEDNSRLSSYLSSPQQQLISSLPALQQIPWAKKGEIPLYVSRAPNHGQLALTILRTQPPQTVRLELRHAKTMQLQQLLTEAPLHAANSLRSLIRHGFSADGHWLWWAKLANKGDNEIAIHWHALTNKPIPDAFPKTFQSAASRLSFSASGHYMTLLDMQPEPAVSVRAMTSGKTLWQGNITTGYQYAKPLVFHQQLPYLLVNGEALLLTDTGTSAIHIDYPQATTLVDLHPHKPWAAGNCGEQAVCVVDLDTKQVIFQSHAITPNSFGQPKWQVHFGGDGRQLFYVSGDRSLVSHKLL